MKKIGFHLLNYIFLVGICILIGQFIGNDISEWRVSLLYLIPPVLFIWLLLYITTKFTGGVAEKATDFIRNINGKEKEFCLVLRPFGKDGHISFSNLFSGFLWDKMLLNWIKEVTIEEVIKNRTSKILNTDTIALVDPELKLIPKSPTYIKTDYKTWKWVLFDLLKYSLVVYIIIPPGKEVRESLQWEVIKAIQLGLLGRIAIILPPMNSRNHGKALASIKKNLFFLSPGIQDLPDDTIAIYPQDIENLLFWFPEKTKSQLKKEKKGKKVKRKNLPLTEYIKIISEINESVKLNIQGKNFIERHININKEYAEFDMEFNHSDLELFLQKQRNPFGFEGN